MYTAKPPVEGSIIKRISREQNMFVPFSFIQSWADKYGAKSLDWLIPAIKRAIFIIDAHRLKRDVSASEVKATFHSVVGRNFTASDLGRHVLIQMMVGHHIDTEKYFTGSNAEWDGSSALKVLWAGLQFSSQNGEDSPEIWLIVDYHPFEFLQQKAWLIHLRCYFEEG
ncbi:hypothetical protein N7540_011029 [Penicillium herquei]|nr:hypothetical protein N7540_011029 [Penicillium herquei]